MVVLLDTNIIIEHLKNGVLSNISGDIEFAVSVITIAELYRFAGIAHLEESKIDEFLLITEIFSVNNMVARRAGYIGRTRKTKIPDLLIAATALEWNVPLITKNLKDFRNIPGLKVQSAP